MSVETHNLVADVSLRCNALIGTDPVELQIAYTTRPLTDEMFGSSIFPMGAIIAACIYAEQKIAEAIAFSSNRTLRAYLRAFSGPLTSGSGFTGIDNAGNPTVGNFGAVLDGADTTKVCTRKPVAFVQNILNAPAIYLVPLYYYALDGATILHTRSTVVMECCVYNAVTQTAKYTFNQNMLFPDWLAEAIVCGAVAFLVRDDEFNEQAARYAGYFTTTLANIPNMVGEEMAA